MADYNEIIRSLRTAANDIANKAKDFAAVAGDKAREVAEDAGDRAKNVTRIAKLKLDIATEKANIKDAYAELGKLVFDTMDKKEVPEPYVRAFDAILLSNAAIERMEAELKELSPEDEAEAAPFEVIVSETEDELGGEDIVVEITEEKEADPEDNKPVE